MYGRMSKHNLWPDLTDEFIEITYLLGAYFFGFVKNLLAS